MGERADSSLLQRASPPFDSLAGEWAILDRTMIVTPISCGQSTAGDLV